MTYGVAQFQAAAKAQLSELGQVRARLTELKRAHGERREELARRLNAAKDELTASLLPAFTPEALAGAARLVGFPGLLQKGFPAQAEAERGRLSARIAGIEAEPAYRDRRLLRDPLVGTLTRALKELEEFRKPFADVVERFRHPRLSRLLEVGYGTPRYAVPFWRTSYYADWKAGDEILERFPGKDAFEEILPGYLEAAGMLETYDPRIASLRAEILAGQRLEEELGAQRQALESLEPRYLGLARIALAQHLEDVPLDSLAGALAGRPDLAVLVRKWSGLHHQLRYLDAIADGQIEPAFRRVDDDVRKLQKDLVKYSRPKNSGTTFAPDAFQRRFDRTRNEKLRKRVDRIGGAHERVYAFESYDRGSFASDFLWWDLMTDGRIDGNFIPEVRSYYEAHPDAAARTGTGLDPDDLAAASAAVSTRPAGRDGLLDAS